MGHWLWRGCPTRSQGHRYFSCFSDIDRYPNGNTDSFRNRDSDRIADQDAK